MKKAFGVVLALSMAICVALPVSPVAARQGVAVGDPVPTINHGKVFALAIGINSYPGHALNWCVADAESFAAMVKQQDNSANITVLENNQATKNNIVAGINALQNAGADDDVLIFYSGHGTNGSKGQSGIVAYDGVNGGNGIIWSGELGSLIKGIHAKRVAVMLDCCYGNGFTNALNLPNVLAMMSSAGLSGESSILGHGAFTYWMLVQGMANGLADNVDQNRYAKPDGIIPFEEAFDYAFQNMTQQKPKVVDNVPGDFWLN